MVQPPEHYRDDPKNIPHGLDGKPLGGGPWLRAGTAEISQDGTYSTNNHKIAIALREEDCLDGKGAIFVAPETNLNNQIIQQHNFSLGDLNVPLSLGASDATQTQFLDEIRNIKQFQAQLACFSGHKATGIKYTETDGGEVKIVPQVTDSNLLGTYNISPTHIIAIVNLEGDAYIAKDSPSLREMLERHSFRHMRTLHVPFAKGEKPANRPKIADPTIEFIDQVQRQIGYQRGLGSMAAAV